MRMSLLKPGLLVSLKSIVSGGVRYDREDISKNRRGAKAIVEEWRTTCVTDDPEEHAQAVKARGKAVSAIRSVCIDTSFGLICPLDRQDSLSEAIANAHVIVDAFNASASYTFVSIFTITGRIAETGEEATRAIASEVRDLLTRMDEGISKLDPEAIRKAADEARRLAGMLSEDKVAAVADAVTAARKAARAIVARVQKKGEAAEVVAKDLQRGAIEAARMAFLDIDMPQVAAPEGEALPVVDVGRFVGVDLDEDEDDKAATVGAAMGDIDVIAAAGGFDGV
jgi:hypothetical protein